VGALRVFSRSLIMDNHKQYENTNLDSFFRSATIETDDNSSSRPRVERENNTVTRVEHSKYKTAKGMAKTALSLAVLGTIVAGIGYGFSVKNAMDFRVKSVGKVLDSGKAEIIDVNMEMPPITLSTAETKVTDVKVAFEQKLTGFFDISLGQNTITRNANVKTLITVDPGEVNINYDSKKDQLIFSAMDTAISTSVDIPTGEATTFHPTGSVALLPAEWLTKVSEAIDGTFGTDSTKVPIIREIAAGTLNIDQGLEKYADLTIVTQVDQECTPLIPKDVSDFTEQLKDNLRTAVQGKLLDTATTNTVSTALKEMPLSKVQKLVENSIVEMPENFTIGPDEENIAKLEDYKKSKFFTSTQDANAPIVCGVSESTKLSLVDEGTK